MVRVEGHRIVRAPVQKVFQLISRLDAQPRVTGLWLTADLLDRKSNTVTIHYRGYFGGMPIESIQRATLYPPQRVEFRQTRGAQHLRRSRHRSGNRNRREHLRPKEQDRDIAGAVVAAVAAAGETARGRHPPLPLHRGKGEGTRYNAGLRD